MKKADKYYYFKLALEDYLAKLNQLKYEANVMNLIQ
jgi:hypothetical protein